jgi:hypothetical protein
MREESRRKMMAEVRTQVGELFGFQLQGHLGIARIEQYEEGYKSRIRNNK